VQTIGITWNNLKSGKHITNEVLEGIFLPLLGIEPVPTEKK
jgi:hypothetical protein